MSNIREKIEIYNIISDGKPHLKKEIIDLCVASGFKADSVSSAIYTMIKEGAMVRMANGIYVLRRH